jgi:hypothetical protein
MRRSSIRQEALRADFVSEDIFSLDVAEVDLSEGPLHVGPSAVVRAAVGTRVLHVIVARLQRAISRFSRKCLACPDGLSSWVANTV